MELVEDEAATAEVGGPGTPQGIRAVEALAYLQPS